MTPKAWPNHLAPRAIRFAHRTSRFEETVDFYREYFPSTLRVPEASVANMLQLIALDHPDVLALDPRTLYDNSLVDEVSRGR